MARAASLTRFPAHKNDVILCDSKEIKCENKEITKQ